MNRQHAPEVAEGGAMSAPPTALLHWIRLGPVTIADLAVLLKVSRRDVEAMVEDLRLRGEPIIAGNDGLKLTEDPNELAAYVEARRRRIVSIYKGNRRLRQTVRHMREVADERAGLTLWDVA